MPTSSAPAYEPPIARRLRDLKNKPALTMPQSPKFQTTQRGGRRALLRPATDENTAAVTN